MPGHRSGIEHPCVEPRPERARRCVAGLASGGRADAGSLQPVRRAFQRRRARARIRRYGRAVALELRHAARRLFRRGRSSLGAGAAALRVAAHLRAIEACGEVRCRCSPGERHAAGASPGQYVGAGLEQHLSSRGPAGVGGGLRPDSGTQDSERSTSAGW